MSGSGEAQRIRALRPPKPAIDPWKPIDVLVEEERGADGRLTSCFTVFLAGAECPFTCAHCDLWRFTLNGPTPRGALPAQLEQALTSQTWPTSPTAIKLYNASNFFDSRAVPTEDLPAIATQLARFDRITVECHPRLVDDECVKFAGLLSGRLEVALGLETVHPEALSRLNKQMTVPQFDSAVSFLRDHGIGTRAFVILSPPYVPAHEAVDWAVQSVEHALDAGVDVVSLIPMRGGLGELARLEETGDLALPTVEMLDRAMEQCVAVGRGVVLADLWDVEAMRACEACRPRRIEHLRTMNRTGTVAERVQCDRCGARA